MTAEPARPARSPARRVRRRTARAIPVWKSSRRRTAGRAEASRPSGPAFARLMLRRHGEVLVNPRHRYDQQASLAVSREHDLAVLSAFEHTFQAVEPKPGLRAVFAMAADTRGLKYGPDVLGKSDVLLSGGRWEFGEVEFVDVDLVARQEGTPGGGKRQQS